MDDIKVLVREKVACFFSETEFFEIGENALVVNALNYVSINAVFQPCRVCVLYFPSLWAVNMDKLVVDLYKVLSEDGVLLIVENDDNLSNLTMCQQADHVKAFTQMRAVVDTQVYTGSIAWLKGKKVIFFQYWKNLVTVSVDNWSVY